VNRFLGEKLLKLKWEFASQGVRLVYSFAYFTMNNMFPIHIPKIVILLNNDDTSVVSG
jgi:hypothetical protein